jgi:beta-glucosidase
MNEIERLLAGMTLDEKIGQLTMRTAGAVVTGPGGTPQDLAGAVRDGLVGSVLNLWGPSETRRMQEIATRETRLGIPVFFGLDVVHGFRTVFPIPLGEAASFDEELWTRTAEEAAREAAHAGIQLTFAPMIDVTREPRWGRIAEGPGEDPVLGSRFAAAKVRGFQSVALSKGGRFAATAKHFVAYGAPTAGREYAPVDISERTLHEVYLPPFKAAVEAGTLAIMPAFNDIAGVPLSAHRKLLRELVREEWGWDGVYISDYNAITELMAHGIAGDIGEAAALALEAGIDIDMMGGAYERGLPIALERRPELMRDLDDSVRRVLALKHKLGLFDDPFPLIDAPEPAGAMPPRRAAARESAASSAVLLTNDGVLPLDAGLRRLAVIGPLADSAKEMLGPWAFTGNADETVSILAGLKAALPECEIEHAPGVAIEGGDLSGVDEAVQLARGADAILLCVGESLFMSGEAASRMDPGLPGHQEALARAVLETGKPIVVLLSSGRPLVIPWLIESASAVLATWFLGAEAGNAIADVLLGRSNPSGKLAITWPRSVGQIPIFYGQRPSGRPAQEKDKFTGKYIDGPNEPQFAFGHGLSYTRFNFSNLRVAPDTPTIGDAVRLEVDVTNDGARAGKTTALVFLHDVVARIAQPVLSLKTWAQVALAPGETTTLTFNLPPEAFAYVGEDLSPTTEPGAFEILVGPSAARSELLSAKIVLNAKR